MNLDEAMAEHAKKRGKVRVNVPGEATRYGVLHAWQPKRPNGTRRLSEARVILNGHASARTYNIAQVEAIA